MNSRQNLLVRLLVSLGLIGFLVSTIDIRDAIRPIPRVGWVYILLMAFLTNVDRGLMSYKWNLLLRARRLEMPFATVMRSYYVGTIWGLFLPTAVGGDILRSILLRRETERSAEVVASVVLERILALASALCLGLFAAIVLPLVIDDPYEILIATSMIVPLIVVISMVAVSFSSAPIRWLKKRVPEAPRRLLAKLKEVYDSYQLYGRDRGLMARFFLWSLVEQCIPVVCVFLISLALDTKAPFVDFLVFVPIIMIPARLPISLDGFGIRESLYVYFFTFVGVPAAEALRLGFIAHVLGLLALLPGFLYFSVHAPAPVIPLKAAETSR